MDNEENTSTPPTFTYVMFWELLGLILIFAVLGTLMGTFTGLVPGVHVNNVAILLLSLTPVLIAAFGFLAVLGIGPDHIALLVCVVIFATSIAHTFLDFIPSTFLGAPEGETALSVLPAHKMLLEGEGYKAVVISALGSFGAIVMAAILIVPFRLVIGNPLEFYQYLKIAMVFILMFIVFLMMVTESKVVEYKKKKDDKGGVVLDENGDVVWEKGTFSRTLGILMAMGLFLMAGTLGLVVLDLPVSSPFGLPATVLFPTLGGLFGIATLFESVKQDANIPPQRITWPEIDKKESVKSIVSGSLAGSTVGFLPGLSAGVATVITMIFRKDPKEEQVIMTLSAINTANSFFVMVALFLILRPRSGAAIVINELVAVTAWDGVLLPQSLAFLLIGGLVAAGLGFLMTVFIGKRCAGFFHKLPYKKLVIGIIVFITAMVFVFTGFLGLLVLLASTVIGLIAPTLGIRRSHAMGVLLLPVIVMLWPL